MYFIITICIVIIHRQGHTITSHGRGPRSLFTLLDLRVCHPCAGVMLIFSVSFQLQK